MSLIALSRLLAALVAAALAFAYVLQDVTPESLPWLDHVKTIEQTAGGASESITEETDKEGSEAGLLDR